MSRLRPIKVNYLGKINTYLSFKKLLTRNPVMVIVWTHSTSGVVWLCIIRLRPASCTGAFSASPTTYSRCQQPVMASITPTSAITDLWKMQTEPVDALFQLGLMIMAITSLKEQKRRPINNAIWPVLLWKVNQGINQITQPWFLTISRSGYSLPCSEGTR